MNTLTDRDTHIAPLNERGAKPITEREFQKTCGCRAIAASEFRLDLANWILCDYHKGKVQTKK